MASKIKVSLLVMVRNEIVRLPRCLDAIERQHYPRALMEVLVIDAHSDDGTIEYARSRGYRVIDNPLTRSEPGYAWACKTIASGDITLMIAADNILHDEYFLEEIVKPFDDPRIECAMPLVVSTQEDDDGIAYSNYFSDPFSHFLFWDAISPWTFRHYYPVKRENESYVVYDFKGRDVPMLATAQGMALRRGFERPEDTYEDDMEPATGTIDRGADVACMKRAYIEHHTCATFAGLVKKFQFRYRDRLITRNRPIWRRCAKWSLPQWLRFFAWPVYSISYVIPLTVSIVCYYRDRKSFTERPRVWLAHASVCFQFGLMMWRGAFQELGQGNFFLSKTRPFFSERDKNLTPHPDQ